MREPTHPGRCQGHLAPAIQPFWRRCQGISPPVRAYRHDAGDTAIRASPSREEPSCPPSLPGEAKHRAAVSFPARGCSDVGGWEQTMTVTVEGTEHAADYAFLSNCHTGALVAPDGGIGWLCIPRFDSTSVFGTLLDRQSGYFRLAPSGMSHPTARSYEPGTNIVATTWQTPTGWILVRDALTMGPREQADAVTPHTRLAGRRRRRPHAGAHRPLPGGNRR